MFFQKDVTWLLYPAEMPPTSDLGAFRAWSCPSLSTWCESGSPQCLVREEEVVSINDRLVTCNCKTCWRWRGVSSGYQTDGNRLKGSIPLSTPFFGATRPYINIMITMRIIPVWYPIYPPTSCTQLQLLVLQAVSKLISLSFTFPSMFCIAQHLHRDSDLIFFLTMIIGLGGAPVRSLDAVWIIYEYTWISYIYNILYHIYIYNNYMKYANQCKGKRLQFLDGKLKSNEQPHTLAMLWHRQRGWAECCVDLPQVESAPAHHCEARAASVLVPLLVIESANL